MLAGIFRLWDLLPPDPQAVGAATGFLAFGEAVQKRACSSGSTALAASTEGEEAGVEWERGPASRSALRWRGLGWLWGWSRRPWGGSSRACPEPGRL